MTTPNPNPNRSPDPGRPPATRRRLPATRTGITHKFSIAGFEAYLTANTYDDGALGDLFINDIGKEGSTLRGVLAMFAMAASVALQRGAPAELLARKLALMNFEPKGPTANLQIPQAQSLGDYFGRWLASQFCGGDIQAELGIRSADAASPPPGALSLFRGPRSATTGDTCPDCGGTLQRTGACQTCTCCGYNTGYG
jgi:ribonucleoside-diphosphate reductase alpha chain